MYAMIGACIAILQDQNQADECIDTACSSLPLDYQAKPPLTHLDLKEGDKWGMV